MILLAINQKRLNNWESQKGKFSMQQKSFSEEIETELTIDKLPSIKRTFKLFIIILLNAQMIFLKMQAFSLFFMLNTL